MPPPPLAGRAQLVGVKLTVNEHMLTMFQEMETTNERRTPGKDLHHLQEEEIHRKASEWRSQHATLRRLQHEVAPRIGELRSNQEVEIGGDHYWHHGANSRSGHCQRARAGDHCNAGALQDPGTRVVV